MDIWNQEKYIKAWKFACLVHNGQLVPGTEIPYINHIGNVAMETMAAIAHEKDIKNPDLLVVCALLHDVIEDTDSTYDEIEREFGMEVADGVLALSKNTNLPSKIEQMKDSIERIQKQPKEVWMVKLSDRITNLQSPPVHWDKEKIKKYRNEAMVILEKLGEATPYLAKRLKMKIAEYEQYL
ncbi:MAG: bifunctional (p)ppGpp synthetase/guanosine-3',5'-bis(diphosphate) 3'-pyrophosphohydrolase [SAR324 cluster bacterium]|nr:bifunctional (p)ppGpp synthetase/guanosine-3',5'-bis(diphosphate) 3'-pyrophosphohydrolase [SAR324 cluster bacterium]